MLDLARKTYNSCKRSLSWLERKNTVIQALSALSIALLTFFLVYYSAANLSQQRKEELVQSRAYVTVVGNDFVKNDNPESEYQYVLNLVYANSGATPAKVSSISYYFIQNEEQYSERNWQEKETTGLTLVGPGQSRFSIVSFKKDVFTHIEKGRNNFLVIDIRYQDYRDNKYTYELKLRAEQISSDKYDFRIQGEKEISGWGEVIDW